MSDSRLAFSINQIIIGRGVEPFLLEDFTGAASTNDPTIIDGDVISFQKTEIEKREDRFLTVYFKDGSKFPYASTVFNSKEMSEVENPRPADNIELKDQLFVLIDVTTQKIYLSDYSQRTRIRLWLRKNIRDAEEVTVKPLFTPKDIIDRIKSLESVELTVVPGTLFSGIGGETLNQVMNHDALGHDAIEARLEIKYHKTIGAEIRDRLKNLWDNKDAYKKVTIIGKDIDNFDATINTAEMITKVVIKSNRDAAGQFVPEEVFLTLIDEIKKRDEG